MKSLVLAAALAANAQTLHAPGKVVTTSRLEFEGLYTGMSHVVSTAPLAFEGLYTEFATVAKIVRTGPLVFEGLAAPSAPVPMKTNPVPPKGIHR